MREIRYRSKKNGENPPKSNFETDLLALAKRVGLSFEELRGFRMDSFFDYTAIYLGIEDDAPKEATQEDIDTFFGGGR